MAAIVDRGVLDELLDPVGRCFTPEVAARIAALRASPKTEQRLDELAEKNSAGLLTDREEEEYSAYVEALDVIAILQAKARREFRNKTSARFHTPQFAHSKRASDFRKRVLPR